MARKQVRVQLQSKYVGQVPQNIQQLRDAGMDIHHVIAEIGSFQGVVNEERLEALRGIAGVASVQIIGDENEEELGEYHIV